LRKNFDRAGFVWFTEVVKDRRRTQTGDGQGDLAMSDIKIELKRYGKGAYVTKERCGIERWRYQT